MLPDQYPELMTVLRAVVMVMSAYILYRFTLTAYFSRKLTSAKSNTNLIVFQRLTGTLLFGGLPALVIFLNNEPVINYGVSSPNTATFLWIGILGIIILPLNFYIARSQENLRVYPQIRQDVWSLQLLFSSAITWIVYLLAYEFMLRGYLFYTTLSVTGLWPAILINAAIYSLIHQHKGLREMIASVPMGIILCYLTYLTGSIWIAVFTHVLLALSNEWFSLYLHPSMVLRRQLK